MNRQRKWTAALVAAVLAQGAAGAARANNLQITNVTVTGRGDTTAFVQFDISWENSWRYTNINHDAAWVFFKVLPDGQSDWKHVTLEGTGTNPTDYVVGAGTPIELIVPTNPAGVGMFVRRSGEGAGTVNVTGVKAVWNFASNSLAKTDKVKLQAFGVEMVYVAEGAFWAGNTNGVINNSIRATDNENSPFRVNTDAQFDIKYGAGAGTSVTISNAFPSGYSAFYCMKFSITQGQYADFLNALTRDQQATRCVASTTVSNYMSGTAGGSATIQNRNTVRLTEAPASPSRRVYTTVTRDRACNFLSWADGAAFADWAGLRPMTELEFEKACRGPLDPVANEYAWGTATIMADAAREISGTEDGTETITSDTSSGGCNYGNNAHTGGDAGSGPLRVGIFATASSTRVSAGASYWGIMELSGNLWERPVTVEHATGRAFTGLHGNGVLNTAGDADVSNWPNTTATGAGFRGGDWHSASANARVSDRFYAALVLADRAINRGSRAVRAVPSGVGP